MRRRTEELLLRIGIYPNAAGFRYIVDAVEMLIKDPGIKLTALYDIVGNRNNSTGSRVERAIRYSSETCDVGLITPNTNRKIKNSEFLALVALRVRQEEEDNE